MDKTERPRHAVVAIIRKDDLFLAIKRAAEIRAGGKICFPGGGIEYGESESQALVREIKEELSLDIVVNRKIWSSVTPWGVNVHWFTVQVVGGELAEDPAEVQWARWMSKEELAEHPDLLVSNKQFFDALGMGEFELMS